MAFLLLLAYIGVLFLHPQEWIAFLEGTHLLEFVAGATILATVFALPRIGWKPRSAPQNILMFAFFGAMLMSNVADSLNWTLFKETFSIFGKIVLLYFLIVILTDSLGKVRAVITVIVLSCLLMTYNGILQYYTGAGLGGALPFFVKHTDEIRVQAFGVFEDPNDFALILVTVLPYLIMTALNRRSKTLLRVLCGVAVLPMLFCIYLTNSRGGWLALGAMLFTLFALLVKRPVLAVIIGGIMIAVLLALGPSRVGMINAEEGSAHNRLILWANGNKMLKSHPLFGVGREQFREKSENGQVAHNSYVHCYAELGLVGYFVWLGLLLSAVKDIWAIHKTAPETTSASEDKVAEFTGFANATIAALAGYLSSSFFLSRTYIPALYVLIALIAATRVIYEREIGVLQGRFVPKDFRYVALVLVASIAVVYVALIIMVGR